jgi:sugar phosphate isomerase/epimerase
MANSSEKDLYFSFFMFTADLRPNDITYTKTIIAHLKALKEFGYTGFDLPIAPSDLADPKSEVESYRKLRQAIDDAGLADVKFTTNVGVTRTFDPSSPFADQRALGLSYLQSRVDISKALRADALAGPIVMPYGVFPTTDGGAEVWSDALQDAVVSRYHRAQPILESLGQYAAEQGIKIAIEPVDHWETPAPNLVGDVMEFLEGVPSKNVGVCIDSAHVVLGGGGPAAFSHEVHHLAAEKRIHYVHISAPDRGAVHGSWIPWKPFLKPIMASYEGPYLIEVFNAIPVFLHGLRITRRKFLIPGEDKLDSKGLNAYEIAEKAIVAVRQEMAELHDGGKS